MRTAQDVIEDGQRAPLQLDAGQRPALAPQAPEVKPRRWISRWWDMQWFLHEQRVLRRRNRRKDRKADRETRRENDGMARSARRKARKAARVRPTRRRELPVILRIPRMVALLVLAVSVALTLVSSLVESWHDLYRWGTNHTLGTFYANGVPLMVDTLIVSGEAALLVMAIEGLRNFRATLGAWGIFLLGLALSLGGNIGHLSRATVQTRATFALPPVGAALSLGIVLMVLKMIAAFYDEADAVQAPEPAPAPAAEVPAPPAAPAPRMVWPLDLIPRAEPLVPVAQPSAPAVPIQAAPSSVKVAQAPAPVAHNGSGAPKVAHPVNGVAHPAGGPSARRPAPEITEQMKQAAREHLQTLAAGGEKLPSDRKLAASHFANNRRAAQRALAEFKPPEE